MKWQRLLDNLFFPLIYLLNRPAFDSFDRLVLMFAYRINGMGISWSGSNGLTISENRFLRRCARFIDHGTVFDVGANVGSYAQAVKAICPHAKITCFEPQPKTFRRLEANCAGAGFALEQLALAARTGTSKLYELATTGSSTVASLTAQTLRTHGAVGESFDVSLDTLDNYCERKGVTSIQLLKVDAEGHDLNVLRGAAGMLSRQAIDIIEFEVTPANIYTDVHFYQLADLLRDYRLFRLCLNGSLAPLQPYDWRFTELYMMYNVIAVRSGIPLNELRFHRRAALP